MTAGGLTCWPDGAALPGRAHLVGAGGAGMRSLASLLIGLGWRITGSDLSPEPAAQGNDFCPILRGHSAANVPRDADWVIYSDAIDPQNVELLQSQSLGISTCSYFEFLGALSAHRQTLAVAGTHGKSTTSAMLAEVLTFAGRDPSWCFGAVPMAADRGGHAGRGDLLVVEACEYRAHFRHLRPWAGILTGIEPDHFDYYRTQAELDAAFQRFLGQIGPDGTWLVCCDCPQARRVAAEAGCRVETFGLNPEADWSARELHQDRGRFGFSVFHHHQLCATVQLAVPGKHQVGNSLATVALAARVGVSPDQAAGALRRFAGVRRRLERLGSWRGADVVDDYAHHPTELAAALAAVRLAYPESRIFCVFQPHQASRTAVLLDELASVMHNAETMLIAEIYRAREGAAGPADVTAADLAQAARNRGVHVAEGHAPEAILAHLRREVRQGDVILVAGAGDIGYFARSLVRGEDGL